MAFANDCLDAIGTPPNRLKVVSVGQCCEEVVALQLIHPMTSEVINLTDYNLGPTASSSSSSSESLLPCWKCDNTNPDGSLKNGVEIIVKETPKSSLHMELFATIDSEDDAQNGIIHFTVNKVLSAAPGIFLGMAMVWQAGKLRRQYPFYFEVTPNLAQYNPSGPITIFEVRMAMRDISPESNFLLDATEFSNEEIAWAIQRPIDYWNEALPPVCPYTPQNFPFRHNWLNATCAELLKMCALWLRRNDLDYSAAGLSIADTKKWPEYYKISLQMQEDWKKWVQNKKISINIAGGFATVTGWVYESYR